MMEPGRQLLQTKKRSDGVAKQVVTLYSAKPDSGGGRLDDAAEQRLMR